MWVRMKGGGVRRRSLSPVVPRGVVLLAGKSLD